jgi:hypothetical protein
MIPSPICLLQKKGEGVIDQTNRKKNQMPNDLAYFFKVCSTIIPKSIFFRYATDDLGNLKYVFLHIEIKNNKHHRTVMFLGSF